jgi:nitrile hydratase
MNGVHDMGGMHGFGPVQPEPNEPTFHSEWEGRCLALNRAMHFTRLWNIDQGRAAIENLPPQLYLRLSYYERWALRLQNLLTEHGLVDVDEIAAGPALRAGKPLARKLLPGDPPPPNQLPGDEGSYESTCGRYDALCGFFARRSRHDGRQ